MKWFLNMKIGAKMITGFLIVSILTIAMGAFALLNIKALADSDTELYENMLIPTEQMSQINQNFLRQRVQIRQALLTDDQEVIDTQLSKIAALRQESDVLDTEFEAKILSDEMHQLFNEYKSTKEAYRPQLDKVITLIENGRKEEAIALLADDGDAGMAAFAEMEAIENVLAGKVADGDEKAAANSAQASSVMLVTIIVMAVVFVLSIVIGIVIANIVSKPVKKIADGAAKLAKGETDIDDIGYDSKDEVGQMILCFDQVVQAVKALVTDANQLVQYAVAGDLSVRTDISKHQGDYKKIVEGINQTLDAITAPIQESAQVLEEMAKGNLKVSVKGDYQGDHALIKNALNATITNLKGYIDEIAGVLGEVAKGNLVVGIDSEYMGDFIALKDSINGIVGSLNEIMQEINISADQVASGTQQVSGGSQEISQGAAEQASAIEELTASVTQIAEQTKLNAGSASEANTLTNGAKDNAEQGNEQMKAMQQAMADINESSGNISKIIKVIDDIAFQTNILALNAAVEAARAGVHGKGFAVVAEEVRNLAARSANAAKETTDLIEGSIRKTEAGTKIADETASALINIVSGVEKAAQLVGEIASASNEQASAIAQVNNGIEQMSQVVQTNSATSEEAAAAAEELSSQAEMLKGMVGQFRLKSKDTEEKEEAKATENPVQPDEPQISLSDEDFGKY